MANVSNRLLPYLQLARPANIVTAVSDVWAGVALSGLGLFHLGTVPVEHLILLTLSTICLYAGGIVMNDVLDIKIDRVERPERVIPSGRLSWETARNFGLILLFLGFVFSFLVHWLPGVLSLLIGICALVYNKWGKHHPVLGPPNMGLCRGLNLLLGMSILPFMVWEIGYLALAPILYIAAITLISRGEVHGSSARPLYGAAFLYGMVSLLILGFSLWQGHVLQVLPFLLPFLLMIFKPLIQAIKDPTGPRIGRSVKAGVMALILMNAAWAAASGSWQTALIITLLLPLSFWFSRRFAVT